MSSGEASKKVYLANELAMQSYASEVLKWLEPGDVVYFSGPLGAGKTTLIRAMLRSLGCTDLVNSPSYTLIETYYLDKFTLHHLDLYRLKSADELEAIGARDLFDGQNVCLIEWPSQGAGFIPDADLQITIEHAAEGRHLSLLINKSSSFPLNRPR